MTGILPRSPQPQGQDETIQTEFEKKHSLFHWYEWFNYTFILIQRLYKPHHCGFMEKS